MFKPGKSHTHHRDDVFIAYGANLPNGYLNGLQALESVVKGLTQAGLCVISLSSLWRSQAWPNPEDPPYHNAVMRVSTDLSPEKLLELLHETEASAGRIRTLYLSRRNAPRPLDLDLIAYGDVVCDGRIILPHPRAHERGFVMGPMSEIAPDWRHPALGLDAVQLYRMATVGMDAYPAEDTAGLLDAAR
ncbi:MAG: 2-amino-4-hydroxy-6-hydroxymethyldihydropteridine diphosphokinase [Asticcacaulis sp.]